MPSPEYLMIGGFLGAGKTTAMLRLAQRLRADGKRVGLITNDQSFGLVDTRLLTSHGFPVEEITGGCFCCRFSSLVDSVGRLAAEQCPDTFLAEPVGSCTDLKATVDYPLRRLYGDQYAVAPYSVLVDPTRAARVLGLEAGKSFSDKVLYIYRKQLEEADLIVVNKVDLLADGPLARLQELLSAQFPQAQVLAISARENRGIDDWLQALSKGPGRAAGAMEVDYDLYADGEALLGWLNGQYRFTSGDDFDGNQFLTALAVGVQNELARQRIQLAHLKMTLSPDLGDDIAVINLVGSDGHPELSHHLQETLTAGELTLNLRAEGAPEDLRAAVGLALAAQQLKDKLDVKLGHLESFRPGRPTPTHRLAAI